MENSTSMSIEIKELVSALCKAQAVMKPAVFNKVNPHFKNKYADFTSCMECCREPLASNGLAVMQYCETVNEKLNLVTMLTHVSGQWIKSLFPLNPAKIDSQSIGSSMTYAKRYSLSALIGIVSEDDDDDGEASQGRYYQGKPNVSTFPTTAPTLPSPIKISLAQASHLRMLEKKLDDDCKKKIYTWLAQSNIKTIEEVTLEMYKQVLTTFENAVKFIEQQKLEVANV